jgi:hypothetical protein
MPHASSHAVSLAAIESGLIRLKWLAAAARFQLALRRHDLALKAGFNPSQPRVPAGNSDGGQWTSGSGGEGASSRDDGVTISDETADRWIEGEQYAQSGPRGPYSGRGPILINGQWVQPTPAQSAVLAALEARADSAIRRVQDIFPEWRPTASLYNTVEGRIARARAEAEQAEARVAEFQRNGILPGLFAQESIPARGPERDFIVSERRQVNQIGRTFGCHTCGKLEPGTISGNHILDHQQPSALNPLGKAQRLFPHCATCSARQGGWITRYGGGWK